MYQEDYIPAKFLKTPAAIKFGGHRWRPVQKAEIMVFIGFGVTGHHISTINYIADYRIPAADSLTGFP